MELENKIKCVLMDFEINEITLQEATKRILLLLDVVDGEKLCYCGHTYKCTCSNPDKTLFKESIKRGSIIKFKT